MINIVKPDLPTPEINHERTIIHRIFETSFNFHVGQRSSGGGLGTGL